MSTNHGVWLDKTFCLLVAIIVLQAVALGLLVRYGGDILDKNRLIEERTLTMMTEIFPSLTNDLGHVSQKTSEIRDGVTGLQSQVAKIDQQMTEVNQGVDAVGVQVADLDRNLQGFVQDKNGLIWGHSLNPYVLVALLAIVAISVPLWGWYYFRDPPETPVILDDCDWGVGFSEKLDKLSLIVKKIRDDEGKHSDNPELQKLMEKTERLIDEARMELILLSGREKNGVLESGGPDILH